MSNSNEMDAKRRMENSNNHNHHIPVERKGTGVEINEVLQGK